MIATLINLERGEVISTASRSRARSGRYAPPKLRKDAIKRSRLLNQLHANVGSGLAVLQAPAGFGKTALLSEFAGDVDYTVRWLRLDEACAAPEVLAERLSIAIVGEQRTLAPSAITKVDDLKAYLGNVVDAVEAELPLPLLLILDEIDSIGTGVDSADLLGWLLEVLPDDAEVILAGRAAPPLVEVDRRVAAGECLWLGAEDLAFNETEVADLIASADPIPAFSASEVMATTRGWPAAVMAILAGTVTLDATTAGHAGAWERYLASDVWRGVSDEVQELLRRISVPPEFDRELAEMLVGAAGYRELSSWLVANRWVFEELEDRTSRLNPFVRSFAEADFRAQDLSGYRECAAMTVQYYLGRGRLTEALEMARASDDELLLAGLLESHSPPLILQGAFATLWRSFGVLRSGLLEERPLLRALRAQVISHSGRTQEALAEADKLLADPGVAGVARIRALLAKIRSLRHLGEPDQLRRAFDEVRLLDRDMAPELRGELTFHEANLEVTVFANYERGEALLREAIELCSGTEADTLALLSRSTLGQLFTVQGEGPAAVNELSRAASQWRKLGGSSNLGWVLNNLGMAHVMVGDFESAVPVLQEAVREGRAAENERNVAYATASLADAQVALGQYQDARVNYEEAIRICSDEAPDETLAALAIAGLASALLGLGETEEAGFFAERAALIAESFENPFEIATCRLVQAAIGARAGDAAVALERSTDAIDLFSDIGASASLRMAHYRKAICEFRAGDRVAAEASLHAVASITDEAWMTGTLLPMVREEPMFAQWAASRQLQSAALREFLRKCALGPAEEATLFEPASTGLPRVAATSLGKLAVTIDGKDVPDEAWASARARELFFLFLSERDGVRKEEAVARLFPELEPEKCNSAFHSNLYRVRRALYRESIVKINGAYALNPDGQFDWDVDAFEEAIGSARALEAGSPERAKLYQSALEQYRGPFAEAFHSEWAETVRRQVEDHAREAFSTLAGHMAARGEFEVAVQCLEQLLRRDQYNEEAAYLLATYRARGGQPAAALTFLDEYRDSYEEELGDRLPRRFAELRSQIAAGIAV